MSAHLRHTYCLLLLVFSFPMVKLLPPSPCLTFTFHAPLAVFSHSTFFLFVVSPSAFLLCFGVVFVTQASPPPPSVPFIASSFKPSLLTNTHLPVYFIISAFLLLRLAIFIKCFSFPSSAVISVFPRLFRCSLCLVFLIPCAYEIMFSKVIETQPKSCSREL